MLAILGGVFMKGFREAIGFSFWIVGAYLSCNVVTIGAALTHITPVSIVNWHENVLQQFHSWPHMIGLSLILFPKLALGMSGFETGVAVMPLVKGYPTDTMEHPRGTHRQRQKTLAYRGANHGSAPSSKRRGDDTFDTTRAVS